MKRNQPADFLLLSQCVDRLVRGMWGSLPRPQPVTQVKRSERDLSVAFGAQREESKALFRAAVLQRRLRIHVRQRRACSTLATDEVQIVPPEILALIIPVRGGLPDHPTHLVRSSSTAPGENARILATLVQGELVVQRSEFHDWFERERARGKWPSQRNALRVGRGRPSMDSETLRNAVLALVQDVRWNAAAGIPALGAELRARGHTPGSRQSLTRVVDRLYRLTGNPALRRVVRKKPTRTKAVS